MANRAAACVIAEDESGAVKMRIGASGWHKRSLVLGTHLMFLRCVRFQL